MKTIKSRTRKKRRVSLSVNVNKIALLRNSRGGNVPDLLQCCRDILAFGAHGITVHPRPDGRHIRHDDVREIKKLLLKKPVEFNVEGYPDERFLSLMDEVRPEQATLVPDPPEALTSNAGWKLRENKDLLIKVVRRLQSRGIRVSLFIDVFKITPDEISALNEIRPDRVELYTEKYAKDYGSKGNRFTVSRYAKVAAQLDELGFGINAGHDLNAKNLKAFLKAVPQVAEVSIGHALISEALYDGLKKTIKTYLKALKA